MELLQWLGWLLVLAQVLGGKCCVREEREALLNIKAFLQTFNDSFVDKRLSSWVTDSNSDCRTWNRVRCHPFSGRVAVLSLQDLWIKPSSSHPNVSIDFSFFHNFKQLTTLNFSQGGFDTLVHTQVLANLSNLEVLVLKNNHIEGPLPFQDLCGLKKIRVLDFGDNAFKGSLPKCLANLTSLQALDLSSNSLTGEIPTSAIASLTSLEYLSLMNNFFEGLFPLSSFTNNTCLKVLALEMYTINFQVDTESHVVSWVPLFQLEVLHLANSKVNAPGGTFPSFLLYQHDLRYLDLSNNHLVGVFPKWLIANNTNLLSLRLNNNSFIGPFELPTNIDQPSHPLMNLQLSGNKMEGQLPKSIGQIFSNLWFLYLAGNRLHGGISTSFGNMSYLLVLDLSRNKFSGGISESFWAGCPHINFLILSHNNFCGKLFSSPPNSSSLEWLYSDNNNLNGTLEHGIWELPMLALLDISNNNFWGTLPIFITNSSSLEVINLSGNNFKDALPREFCKLSLLHLHLSYNKLSGSIPACYINITDLLSLELQSNGLVGSIPSVRNSRTSLLTLDLRDNNLSGGIPNWIFRADMRVLLLGGNHLQGQLPNQLCQLERMNFLDLSQNNFTGNIPACLCNVSFGERDNNDLNEYEIIRIRVDSHYWFNPLHLELLFKQNRQWRTGVADGVEVEFRTKDSFRSYQGGILRLMSGIDLSSNQLTGEIPQGMGYLAFLHALNLSHNHLNGSIPESFHKLQKIESLDLSFNNLDGEIPPQLQDLASLEVFNVSYNNLSGIAPSSGQFGAFDESSYIGNPHLTWRNSNRGNTTPIPPPPPPPTLDKEDESLIDFTSFIWSFWACYVAVLLILVTVLWINPYWRRVWFDFIKTCLYRCFYPYLKDAFC